MLADEREHTAKLIKERESLNAQITSFQKELASQKINSKKNLNGQLMKIGKEKILNF